MSASRVMPRRGLLGLILAVHWLAAATIICAAEPADQPAGGARSTPRPRVGLVLSGGGARGAAHIGVLKVLEQLQVPVDAIAGTSMGAVVGGLYASGLSAAEIEKIMTSVNWQQAFRDRPPREDLTLRRKEEDQTFLVKFPLYVQDGRVLLPKGLIQGQTLTQMLRRLTLPVALINNFDELPTPFRAVATDLETGDAVVMRDGDLTSAMRASLSAPGVFAPVERDGRLLVDGGLADNVPVDVARAMGVERVIVVDVGFPLQARRRLSNAPAISNQSVAILIQRNARAQLATLTAQDILIQPALGDISSFDFGSVARVVSIGERAARGQEAQLAAFSADSADMQRYQQRRQQPRAAPPRIDFVRVEPGSERYAVAASSLFSDLTGKPLDPRAAAQRVTALYGRGGLDTLDYRIVGEPGDYGLALDARPSSQGSNYLRFGLSLQDDFEGNSSYSAAMRFVMGDITRNAGEWVTDVQIGSVAKIATELFLPLAQFSGWFVMPHAAIGSHDLDIVQDQNLLAEYRVHDTAVGLDFGRQFGNWGEIRAGAQREHGHFFLKVGDPTAPGLPPPEDVAPFDMHDYFLRLTYDRLDDVNFPHRGQQATLQWSGYHDASATQQTNEQVTANYLGAYSRGRDTLSFSASGGMTLQSTLSNINLLFPLGGFLNLSGLRTNSLLGPNYGIARLLYYRQIGRGGPGYFDVPTYLGASLEAGNVWQTRSEASLSNTRKNASVFLGMDTFLGPVYLAAGFDQHGDQAFYLFLGKTF